MINELSRPAIFAHRGSSSHAPENTLPSFELALRHGADAIELDAKLTADQQVVVIHDQTIDRTTNGSGKVNSFTLEQIRQFDAGISFDIAFQNTPIPTLDEIFKTLGHAIFINVELTNYASPTDKLPEKVAELVKGHGLEKRVHFSSFNPLALLKIHKLLPTAPIGLLAQPGINGAWARSWLGKLIPHQALHPAMQDTNAKTIQRVHKDNRLIYVYTVNDPEDMRRLFNWGVDGIFTDDPLLARRLLMEKNR